MRKMIVSMAVGFVLGLCVQQICATPGASGIWEKGWRYYDTQKIVKLLKKIEKNTRRK